MKSTPASRFCFSLTTMANWLKRYAKDVAMNSPISPRSTDPERRERIPDPNALPTFEQSAPSFAANEHTEFYRHLLRLRHQHIVPHLPGSVALGAQVLADRAVSARWRLGNGSLLQIDLNLSATALDQPAAQHVLFQTPAHDHAHLAPFSARVTLSPVGEHP